MMRDNTQLYTTSSWSLARALVVQIYGATKMRRFDMGTIYKATGSATYTLIFTSHILFSISDRQIKLIEEDQ